MCLCLRIKDLSLSESKTLARTPKADVYKQIELDLTNAIDCITCDTSAKRKDHQICSTGFIG